MSKKIWIGLALVLLVAVVALKMQNKGGPHREVIRIGAILPLTGDAAQWGIGAKRGIELAVDEYNSFVGLSGRQVFVVYEDDQLEPRIGTQAMQKLVSVNHVQAVIGSISSSVTLAIAPIAENNNVVLISPASTSHEITNAGDFIFRTISSDIFEGRAMAKFAYEQRDFREIAIISVNSAGTKGMADAFLDMFSSLGGKVVIYELVSQGITDFRASATKTIAENPEAIYVVGFPLETAHMIKQLVELGFEGQLLSAQPAEDPEVRKIAGRACEGLIFTTTTVDPDVGSEATKSFCNLYSERFSVPPQVFSYEAYDAARLILEAIVEGASIRDFLYEIRDYEGASGEFSIDDNGDVEKQVRFVVIRNKEIVPIKEKLEG